MKYICYALFIPWMIACSPSPSEESESESGGDQITTSMSERPTLSPEQAGRLAELPLGCVEQEYPNKLGQTLAGPDALGEPAALHPAFYGCFDWHSAVHGHWSLVALLKDFPGLPQADTIRRILTDHLSAEKIAAEVAYFERDTEKSYERTYGWAWLLKLDEELLTWEDTLAARLHDNLQPLTSLIVDRYLDFLPRLNYAIRTGEHPNTAFGLTFAYDYALAAKQQQLREEIVRTAKRFYTTDRACPIAWEPGGYDFLSPCLEEVDIMRRVLPAGEFTAWLDGFLPGLTDPTYELTPATVSDRTDGKLVHLDGLNFSRAWVLGGLADQYPQRYGHLRATANTHLEASLPNLVGDGYEGGHWLGSFALYALR